VEAVLLAHVLRDESGEAAAALLAEGEAGGFATPEADQLFEELTAWRKARAAGGEVSPVDHVQNRWHDRDASYRRYVSDLLTKEVIPRQTDFAKVVRDCLRRLAEDRKRRRND
jgi:hypothetical protein